MYAEIDDDGDSMFIVNLNNSELHFGLRDFAVILRLHYRRMNLGSTLVDPDLQS